MRCMHLTHSHNFHDFHCFTAPHFSPSVLLDKIQQLYSWFVFLRCLCFAWMLCKSVVGCLCETLVGCHRIRWSDVVRNYGRVSREYSHFFMKWTIRFEILLQTKKNRTGHHHLFERHCIHQQIWMGLLEAIVCIHQLKPNR